MSPTDFAAVELALWEQALQEQRDAERKLQEARRRRRPRIYALLNQVEVLRMRADLLLADAVKVKCTFRDAGNTVTSSCAGLF